MLDRLPLDSPEWLQLVQRMPGATVFHHPVWAAMIAGAYGFGAFALAHRREERGDYVAGIPVIELRHPLTRRRRWSSLPFTDTCPPLVVSDDAGSLAAELDARRGEEEIAQLEVGGAFAGAPATTSARRVLHTLPLDPDPDVVEKRYRSSVRRNVRAARSSGLVLRRAVSESDMTDVFYRLQVLTRRRLGLPAQPRGFFRRLWQDVIAQGYGHLTIVELDGAPVAGAVFLVWNDVTIYKYGASDPRGWHLRPNNLIFADEIASACRAGCRSFHFGRTDVEDEGLRRFKLGWGAEEEPLHSTVFGAPAEEGGGPPSVVRSVVRRSPPIVARMAGSVLYRYAA